jgi:hypothetical protein
MPPSLALFGRGQAAVSPAALPNSPDFTKVNWPNLPFFLTFLRAYLPFDGTGLIHGKNGG